MGSAYEPWTHARRHSLIPGGAHTYSRGDDQYPALAPEILVRGKGCQVWDQFDNRYLDWGMGLRSVILGYADVEVDQAAFEAAKKGINLSRVTIDELELAQLLTEIIPGAEMVKFGKNGSDATAAAIRLARAFTGRDLILRCRDNPFLGVHDWFIGSTVMNRGIPRSVADLTKTFAYNDLDEIDELINCFAGKVAAIILEPVGFQSPNPGYLVELKRRANDNGIVLIFDETITGFRLSIGGAQSYYGVTPDLSTFGKALANGYPLSALVGRREIMELGGIEHTSDRVFVMSSTYGAERASIAAGMTTIRKLQDSSILADNANVAENLVNSVRHSIDLFGLNNRIRVEGLSLLPKVTFLDDSQGEDFLLKTLFMQEMVIRGCLLPPYFMSVCAAHRQDELEITASAIHESLDFISNSGALDSPRDFVKGAEVKPVFRSKN